MVGRFDIRRLATLRAVAHGGSFAAAAEALWLTPSAVSQQMGSLERAAGAALFERTARGMRLTRCGWALTAHAEAILAEVARAEQELAELACGHRGRVRIGSFPAATAAFVAAALARFHARHPAIGLELVDGAPEEHLVGLRAGELDLVLVARLGGLVSGGELRHTPLFADPLLVVAPRGHRLAARPAATFADLAGEPILGGPGSPLTAALVRAARDADVELRLEPRLRTGDPAALQALVAGGHGLALLPRLAVEPLHPELVARRIERAPDHQVVAVLADTVPSPPCVAMLDTLREVSAHRT